VHSFVLLVMEIEDDSFESGFIDSIFSGTYLHSCFASAKGSW